MQGATGAPGLCHHGASTMQERPRHRRAVVRPQDAVWLLLFVTLAWFSPAQSPVEIALLLCLGVFQVVEPRVEYFGSDRGTVTAVLIKLALCYLLMGWTGGITSSYHLTLLLPVISAAVSLNLAGTAAVLLLTCLSYLSFLLYLDWTRFELTAAGVAELALRVIFLPVVGLVTWQLAEANRLEARKSQAVALELARANESLHEAEAAVRRSDRLAALGQLTAGLAHELRNPLGTIRASAEMLRKNLADGDAVTAELAGFIATEVDRTNSLITCFLEFARPLKLRAAPASVDEMLDRAIADYQRQEPDSGIAVIRNYAPDVPAIEMDSELMERVFLNLLLNAAQATAAGGAVTIRTRPFDDGVEIAVLDRGRGIAKSDLENIFNPFFTTRPDGVGLGLAIVSKVIDEHGGRITVDSEPGRGTTFRVYLSATLKSHTT